MDSYSKGEQKVDIAILCEKSKNLSNEVDALKNSFNELKRGLDEIKLYWSGAAADAFIGGMNRCVSDLSTYVQSLEKVSQDYSFAADTYIGCEQRVSEIIDAVEI